MNEFVNKQRGKEWPRGDGMKVPELWKKIAQKSLGVNFEQLMKLCIRPICSLWKLIYFWFIPRCAKKKSLDYIRNRKHFACFYQGIETVAEVKENKKCCGNTNRKPVFSSFCEFSLETVFLQLDSFRKPCEKRKGKPLLSFQISKWKFSLLVPPLRMSTAHADRVSSENFGWLLLTAFLLLYPSFSCSLLFRLTSVKD